MKNVALRPLCSRMTADRWLGVKQLKVIQKRRFQMLHRLPIIRPMDNLPQEVHKMLNALEIYSVISMLLITLVAMFMDKV